MRLMNLMRIAILFSIREERPEAPAGLHRQPILASVARLASPACTRRLRVGHASRRGGQKSQQPDDTKSNDDDGLYTTVAAPDPIPVVTPSQLRALSSEVAPYQ